jgi:hypothetical protein
MGFLISPGVEIKETDLTNIIPALATSVGGFAGFFRWGPVNTPVNVGSETELARLFGAPSTKVDDLERSFLTAASYLKYSNTLRVVRAADGGSNAHSGNDFTNGYGYGYSVDGTGLSSLNINNIGDLSLEQANLEAAYVRFVARYTGAIGNSIGVVAIDSTTPTDEIPVAVRTAKTYNPTSTDWSNSQASLLDETVINDELTIVVYDRLGLLTGSAGEILEVYQGLSYFTGAKNSSGQTIYWADVLNNSSSYVWGVTFNDDKSGLTNDEYSDYWTTQLFGGAYQFEAGTDATTFDATAITDALSQFENSESIDINFVFSHNFEDNAKQLTVDNVLISLADSIRKDCLAFISAPLSISTLSVDSTKLSTVKSKFSNLPSTSYVVFDSTPVYVYNRYRDAFAWIPACGHMAGLCAKTDRLTDPWFSPAGFNRGNLLGVTKLAYNPKQADRDDLYTVRINPIISSPGNGIVLFGDKTALAKPGAFDRINVRRLFITIEKAIATASKFLLFELNDEFTRAAFRNAVEPYLREVQGRRGIIDFRVICDESNNTPEVIDTNRFVGTIYIKPSKSINYITLNFVAVRTGVSFEEVIGTNI